MERQRKRMTLEEALEQDSRRLAFAFCLLLVVLVGWVTIWHLEEKEEETAESPIDVINEYNAKYPDTPITRAEAERVRRAGEADMACYNMLETPYLYMVYSRELRGHWRATMIRASTGAVIKDVSHTRATPEFLAAIDAYYKHCGQPTGYGSGYFTWADVARVLGLCPAIQH